MKRPRKRPHVRNPEGGFCPGCDDELGVGGGFLSEREIVTAAVDWLADQHGGRQ